MVKTPQIEPVTSFIKDHKRIIAKLNDGPIFLAQRSRPAAVLVSVDDWDRMVSELENYHFLALLDQRSREMDTDPNASVRWEDAEKELIRRGLVDA